MGVLVSSAELMDASLSNKIPLRVEKFVISHYLDTFSTIGGVFSADKDAPEDNEADMIRLFAPGTWILSTFKGLEVALTKGFAATFGVEKATKATLQSCMDIFIHVLSKYAAEPDWPHFARSTEILAKESMQEYALGVLKKLSTMISTELNGKCGYVGQFTIFLAYAVLAHGAISEAHAKKVAPPWNIVSHAVTEMVHACMELSEKSARDPSFFASSAQQDQISMFVMAGFRVLANVAQQIMEQENPGPVGSIPDLLRCVELLGRTAVTAAAPQAHRMFHASVQYMVERCLLDLARAFAACSNETARLYTIYPACSNESARSDTMHSEVAQEISSVAVGAVETMAKIGLVFSAAANTPGRIDKEQEIENYLCHKVFATIGHILTTLTFSKPLSEQMICVVLTAVKVCEVCASKTDLPDCLSDFGIRVAAQMMLFQRQEYPKAPHLAQYAMPSDVAGFEVILKKIQTASLQEHSDMKWAVPYIQEVIDIMKVNGSLNDLKDLLQQRFHIEMDEKAFERNVLRGKALAHRRCANLECTHFQKNVDEDVAVVKRCSACKTVKYCCKGCQKTDWKNGHKIWCKDLRAVENASK